MAITLPVYTRTARQDVGDPGGTAEFPAGGGGAIKIRVHGDAVAEADSPGIARGLIVGVAATCSAAAGTVTIRVYNDDAKTTELWNVGLDLSATPFKSSNTLAQGVPFFAPPHFTIQCSVDPNAKVFVTFYIKSIAGNG
jgi:hypothetical protein